VYPITAFAHSGIGQADEHKVGLAANYIDLHFNKLGIQADDGTAQYFGQHNRPTSFGEPAKLAGANELSAEYPRRNRLRKIRRLR
jgi:hypothetical protein